MHQENAQYINPLPKDQPPKLSIMIYLTDLLLIQASKRLKAKQLANALKMRGQKTAGKKNKLLEWLINAIDAKVPVSNSLQTSDLCMNGLAPTAYWKELEKRSTHP